MESKTIVFQSLTALEEWKKLNYPFVRVVSVSTPDTIFSFDMSSARMTPNISVEYIEFSRENP